MQRFQGDWSLLVDRRSLMLGGAASVMLPTWHASAQTSSVLNIATSGDPGPLDPTPVTSDLLSEITQLFYETLYIFGPDYGIAPLLAAALPEISDDGKRYIIRLRSGVPFHDGSTMNADDVVASLQRWGRLSPRGRTPWTFLDSISAKDPGTIEIVLTRPYSPLLNLLAFPNGSPQIMPKRVATAPDPLKDFTGTGPFKLIEYKPDTWVRVGKFAQYVSPPGAANGYVGRREALVDEIRFLPSPNPTTRADGLLAGQYHWADNLTPESYARIHDKPDVVPGVLTAALWVLFIMNTKKGMMSNVLLRRAAQAAINCTDALGAAFGDKSLWKLQGSIYPRRHRMVRCGCAGLQPGQSRKGGGAAEAGRLQPRADPYPHQCAVRLPVQDRAGDRGQPERSRLQDRPRGHRLGDDPATPAEPGSVGGVRDRTWRGAGAVLDHDLQPKLSGLVGYAGQARPAGRLRDRERSGEASATVAQAAGAVLH